MKKTHWLRTTLITLVACGLAGLLLAVILFQSAGGRTGASSTIQFSFDGAAEGIAPNGYRFDLSGFTSDEVLSAALEDVGLADRYTANQLRENLLISGVYPEDIVSQMTGYESLITGDAGKVSIADYHATLYTVTLYNDFDKSIARQDLENLLGSIMTEFRTYFGKTYSFFLADDTMVDHLFDYDYAQQVDILTEALNRTARFAREMAGEEKDFLMEGEGFADIAARYETLISSDLERISGQVTMNALSRDQDRIVSQYENQIKTLKIQLKELTQEAEDTDALISQYAKDDLIYVATADVLQQVGSTSTKTYDTLVARYQEIKNEIAEANKALTELQLRLQDILGEATEGTGTDAEVETAKETTEETAAAETFQLTDEEREARNAAVEKSIDAILRKREANNEQFAVFLKAYAEEEMNDRTIAVSEVKYSTPSLLSGSFIKQAIRTAGPLCAVGFMICLIGVIVSRRKEEKGRQS